MANDIRYFNFPIQLLEGFLTDQLKVLNNICDYAIYDHCLKLEHGTEIQRITASAEYFNVTLGSVQRTLKDGKALHNSIDEKSPKVGINLTIFWDYFKNEKTEFDNVCLLAFLAIKSIVQKKTYCKVDNRFLLARMDGKAKSCDFEQLSSEIFKYANEYQTKKIKTALRNGWSLTTYSRYTRGFYVSFSMTLESLIYEAEKRRQSTKEKQYKIAEKEALNNVLLRLKMNTTNARP